MSQCQSQSFGMVQVVWSKRDIRDILLLLCRNLVVVRVSRTLADRLNSMIPVWIMAEAQSITGQQRDYRALANGVYYHCS